MACGRLCRKSMALREPATVIPGAPPARSKGCNTIEGRAGQCVAASDMAKSALQLTKASQYSSEGG